MSAKPSLRRRLAQHVLVPLALTWALGTAIVLGIAEHFAAQAFDRALLDDAYELASHVHANRDRLAVALTPEEASALLFDQVETQYFAVLRPDGSLLAGDARLRAAALAVTGEYKFANLELAGRQLRTVSLRRDTPEPFIVVMAQTTASRSRLLERLLLYSALPQAALLMLLAWGLRRRIQGDLEPLARLEEAIGRRHAADLAPLPQPLHEASTRDVERIARAIDSLFARLQQSQQAQREFAGDVAHELRTPLAGIRAQAAFALAHQDARVWREQLEGIAHAEHRASRLVDQLLALARADEGSTGVATQLIDVGELARDVLLRFMPRARAAGVDLGGEGLDDDGLTVRGDRALLEGIANNLLDNALRHGAGAAQPRITLAVSRMADRVGMSVTDNGAGLQVPDTEQLKKRWVRGEAGTRAGEGAGLGLSIVARYAELLGARFALANAPGGGLQAGIELPAA